MPELSSHQQAVVERPPRGTLFLSGPAGSGKTTAAVARLVHLLAQGVWADAVLVLIPQRTLAEPYLAALRRPDVVAGGLVSVATLGGLAQRMVDLFWPLVAEEAGFAHPHRPPTFLTLETAQYFMARLVRPLLEQGYFETITIDRNRLYSQILDNLNKAAVVGFPYTELGPRLKAAWVGEPTQRRIYDEAQECAIRFREFCLQHNLLDFSLQLEVFLQHLWPQPLCRDYLLARYRHLIYDNVEEDTPVAHDLLRAWLPRLESALLIHDTEAGYRRFLGADPESAAALGQLCDEQLAFSASFVTTPAMAALQRKLARALHRRDHGPQTADHEEDDRQQSTDHGGEDGRQTTDHGTDLSAADSNRGPALVFESCRYHPEMLDWVAGEITRLVREQAIPPGEIVVLAPFLSDSLRFSLMNRLERRGIPARSHRPSRALRDEPATQCLLTLTALAHPAWGLCPTRFDVAYALMQAIEGLDLVRAQLLAEIVYRVKAGVPTLAPFAQLNAAMQERITFVLGNRYEQLRTWLAREQESTAEALDHFLSRLFGEVLSQPGFGFHGLFDAGAITANLIESIQKFRWAIGDALPEGKSLGQEYLEMVQDGVVAAQYIRSWQTTPEEAVLLAPAYTFLMTNRPVTVQFWLEAGSPAWWERLYQPLTQPYVLSRAWPGDRPWTDTEEYAARQETLYRLVLGLLRRCRSTVYLALSELGEQGFEQQGPLLKAFQQVLRMKAEG